MVGVLGSNPSVDTIKQMSLGFFLYSFFLYPSVFLLYLIIIWDPFSGPYKKDASGLSQVRGIGLFLIFILYF